MIIDIGTEVDESVIRWKHKETDEWQKADIDELIDAYENIVRCKDCRYRKRVDASYYCELDEFNVKNADFCSWGERKGGDSE